MTCIQAIAGVFLVAVSRPMLVAPAAQPAASQAAWVLETESFRYRVGPDGRILGFVDKATGQDHVRQTPPAACAHVRVGGKDYAATKVERVGKAPGGGEMIRVGFGDSGVTADLRCTAAGRHAVIEVADATGGAIDELTFIDVPLALKGAPEESFAACALALNLKTNVPELPGPRSRLRATCYPRFGLTGAGAALVAAPTPVFRQALQEAVTAAPDVPHSPLGGPWALDAEINQGSYLFNFTGLTEATADEWIRTARACGMNQIDFHGGGSFRFGDLRFNPKLYPRGKESMKAVIDKLHAAGIKAGLHTYAFFIDKGASYVTPVPDRRLGKDATFTLAADLSAEAGTVPVDESTEKMSTTTGFFVPNSVTLQIDDELIVYAGIDKRAPFAFTQCKRGAYGTQAAAHRKGAAVHHLRECFGLFLPDGDSTLFEEVAAKTAETFNDCGFDMMYLDALDGEGVVAGPEAGWHYGSKFVFEIWKRLKRPALMEMSTFHHHLWYVRSRYVAWDHPNRGHKPFIDLHCAANEESRRMFLPGHLGWWAVLTWTGDPQVRPTFADDVEYLCCKGLGTDTGFSLIGVSPETLKSVPAFARLADITRRYEELRHARTVPESIKARLREPGREYTLVGEAEGGRAFRPVRTVKHTVGRMDGVANVWTVENPFDRQPVKLRIEALWSVGPYDATENPVIADPGQVGAFGPAEASAGVSAALSPSPERTPAGQSCGRFTARNASADRPAAGWASVTRTFSPPLDIKDRKGLGLWVRGDGKGGLLNLQLRSPDHLVAGFADHYLPLDFTGWRYVELVEAEGDRCAQVRWPYSDAAYDLYRENVHYDQVSSLGLWYGGVQAGADLTCHVGPVKALPLVAAKLSNPRITIDGRTIRFPVTMETGSYLELTAPDSCRLYGPKGEPLAEVKLDGPPPELKPGRNRVEFQCEQAGAVEPRVLVTTFAHGGDLSPSF
ncbi:MAG: hypothetical protein HRF43_11130 [Phycisphaerae bacterium]|jgi:hypothetical protein